MLKLWAHFHVLFWLLPCWLWEGGIQRLLPPLNTAQLLWAPCCQLQLEMSCRALCGNAQRVRKVFTVFSHLVLEQKYLWIFGFAANYFQQDFFFFYFVVYTSSNFIRRKDDVSLKYSFLYLPMQSLWRGFLYTAISSPFVQERNLSMFRWFPAWTCIKWYIAASSNLCQFTSNLGKTDLPFSQNCKSPSSFWGFCEVYNYETFSELLNFK